ncbi:hypothetical protein Rsub_07988 [Raphidocelis subcapitata]|uniref:Tetrapyrrole methylase domain-containing protein n=1 Tax=Raphidocelis subcapitata TaxID=307507 RepID=A0A2V0P4N7_9CHLO|nr:hypothetical protein Rsub_07988 [Raphidocelis subcapitata]|eukprot:GBF94816.1 hypothetical protein Rsub_07988 [Raphidocelis subcapitata]
MRAAAGARASALLLRAPPLLVPQRCRGAWHQPCGRRALAAAAAAAAGGGEEGPDAPSTAARGSEQRLQPGLYLVGTPIGNLEDISVRALRVLRGVDTVLAEDTRHSRRLLDHFGIRTPLLSCHEHNEQQRARAVVQRLQSGESMALISDAGMPAISDPGAALVAAAAAAGVPVWPVPGPCAALCGLVGSGLPTGQFLFCGFLPPKQAARRAELRRLAGQRATLLFYVPPHALLAVLSDAAEELGGARRCCVARELTKLHEEFSRTTLAEALADYGSRPEGVKGEIVLAVEGASEAAAAVAEAGAQAALGAAAGQRRATAAAAGGGDSSCGSDSSGGGGVGSGDGGGVLDAAATAAAADAGAAAAAASSAAAGDVTALRQRIAALLREGASVSDASRQLAQQLAMGRSQVYKLALTVKQEEASGGE